MASRYCSRVTPGGSTPMIRSASKLTESTVRVSASTTRTPTGEELIRAFRSALA